MDTPPANPVQNRDIHCDATTLTEADRSKGRRVGKKKIVTFSYRIFFRVRKPPFQLLDINQFKIGKADDPLTIILMVKGQLL